MIMNSTTNAWRSKPVGSVHKKMIFIAIEYKCHKKLSNLVYALKKKILNSS